MPKIRVLIVDDHPVVREGLRAVLGLQKEFQVVGEAADGEAAIEAYRTLRPDVAIIDLRLPLLNGAEAIARIRGIDANARIVALTSFGGDADVRAALKAGAQGFVLKGASGCEVIEAVRRVMGGERYLAAEAEKEIRQCEGLPSLSTRELEVLELVGAGLHNAEISERLGLSVSTVKAHVNHILEKLGAQDRTEAVMLALRRGVIHLP